MKRQYGEPTFRRVKGEGLFKKYNVTRVDGEPVDVPCFVMELRPKESVCLALEAYAHGVKEDNPALAVDLEGKAVELRATLSPTQREPGEVPEVICLCGSSRFVAEMAVIAWELEKEGKIVFGLHLLPSWYSEEPIPNHLAEHEGVAEQMDELHLRKIDISDRVLVVNPGGYFGDSTKREIAYAEKTGKPVAFIDKARSDEPPAQRERDSEAMDQIFAGQNAINKPLRALAVEIAEVNRANGWNTPKSEDWDDPNRIPTFLCLIHSEVSEALEGFRADDRANVAEELADTLIRVLDLAFGLGIDIDLETKKKIAKNRQRERLHGGKQI